eukprot:5838157-Pleurochrysis_carterae.AAC.1
MLNGKGGPAGSCGLCWCTGGSTADESSSSISASSFMSFAFSAAWAILRSAVRCFAVATFARRRSSSASSSPSSTSCSSKLRRLSRPRMPLLPSSAPVRSVRLCVEDDGNGLLPPAAPGRLRLVVGVRAAAGAAVGAAAGLRAVRGFAPLPLLIPPLPDGLFLSRGVGGTGGFGASRADGGSPLPLL